MTGRKDAHNFHQSDKYSVWFRPRSLLLM